MIFLLRSVIYLMVIIKSVTPTRNIISEMHGRDEIVLSRKKRYLIFPEGSSLQLVYCLTVPSIAMGRIFTIGSTAALAWELPHTPYKLRRKMKENASEKFDKVETLQQTSGGWTTLQDTNDKQKKYSKNKLVFHNSTIYDWPFNKGYIKWKTNRNDLKYHTINNKNYNYDDSSSYHDYHFIHRKTRRDLYAKIQKFFLAQNKDGKACLLKAICEVSNVSSNNVGTFMEELLKAIFRSKPHENYANEDEYDVAYNKDHNCTDMYPTCKSSVWNVF